MDSSSDRRLKPAAKRGSVAVERRKKNEDDDADHRTMKKRKLADRSEPERIGNSAGNQTPKEKTVDKDIKQVQVVRMLFMNFQYILTS